MRRADFTLTPAGSSLRYYWSAGWEHQNQSYPPQKTETPTSFSKFNPDSNIDVSDRMLVRDSAISTGSYWYKFHRSLSCQAVEQSVMEICDTATGEPTGQFVQTFCGVASHGPATTNLIAVGTLGIFDVATQSSMHPWCWARTLSETPPGNFALLTEMLRQQQVGIIKVFESKPMAYEGGLCDEKAISSLGGRLGLCDTAWIGPATSSAVYSIMSHNEMLDRWNTGRASKA